MIRVILIRHGRTAWNAPEGEGQRFRGITDLPLATEGVEQAQLTSGRLARGSFDAIFCSPLQRAVHTAQIIGEPHGLSPQVLPGLSSLNFGDWAGLLDTEVATRWPDEYRQWRRDPFSLRIPGGGSPSDLRARAVAAVHEAIRTMPPRVPTSGGATRSEHGGPGLKVPSATLVLVSHELVCRTLVCALAGLPNEGYWRIRQGLCNLTTFDFDRASGQFALVSMNDTCHLSPGLQKAHSEGIRILLLRHAQTSWNEGAGVERFRGRADLSLDSAGQAQAITIADRLGREIIAAIYSSPLLRARQTVAPLARTLGLPVRQHGGLIDMDYGQFQGLSHAEAAVAYPDLYATWRTRPSQVGFPGGEKLVDLRDRVLGLLEELPAAHRGQTVVLVGHQMVNKVAACTLLGLDLDQIWRIAQDACGFDLFQSAGEVWHTLLLNDTCHLA